MYIYTCEPTIEAMLSCIYEAWSSKKGHQNIKLMLEPVEQYTLFDQYIHVDADEKKVLSVMDAVCQKLSPIFYQQLIYTAIACEEDAFDNIYRCMILGFAYGTAALEMVQFKDVMRNKIIRKRLSSEINRFQEIMRFHQIDQVYIAHFEPKSRIAVALGPIFEDRMPSEHWMIIDDIHKEAVIHPKDQHFYMRHLSDEEFERLAQTELINDHFTDMWAAFFDSITIKERTNPTCQLNHFPLWARKHAVEFNYGEA